MIKALQALGITLLIMLGAWGAETIIDTVRPRTGLVWRLLIFFGMGLLVFALFIHFARAHDNPTDWIGQERRTNADRQLCCGEGELANRFPPDIDETLLEQRRTIKVVE